MSYLQKSILHCKYFGYLHKTETIVIATPSTVNWTKFYLSSTIIGKISPFVDIIFFHWSALLAVQASERINNIVK